MATFQPPAEQERLVAMPPQAAEEPELGLAEQEHCSTQQWHSGHRMSDVLQVVQRAAGRELAEPNSATGRAIEQVSEDYREVVMAVLAVQFGPFDRADLWDLHCPALVVATTGFVAMSAMLLALQEPAAQVGIVAFAASAVSSPLAANAASAPALEDSAVDAAAGAVVGTVADDSV